jgi:hypothetical protein
MNCSHTNAIALLGRTINTVNHGSREATLEWFRLARPIRIGAGHHNRSIPASDGDQFLWIRFPPLDIQHTIADVLKIDE